MTDELEQRIAELTAELQAANNELDSFAYAVSHDLRAPLRAMAGFSQALIEDFGNEIDGEAHVYLEQIIAGSRRMGVLVDGLLELSRSTRGVIERVEFDLAIMTEQVLRKIAKASPERQVSWSIEPELIIVGDPRMLEIVLTKLLENAWKFSAKAESPRIDVFSKTSDGQTQFCISDNGAGFDMSHAERLFQPFQRLHREEEFSGVGVGLAAAQRIIHRLGGTIKASSSPNKGACFCFTVR